MCYEGQKIKTMTLGGRVRVKETVIKFGSAYYPCCPARTAFGVLYSLPHYGGRSGGLLVAKYASSLLESVFLQYIKEAVKRLLEVSGTKERMQSFNERRKKKR